MPKKIPDYQSIHTLIFDFDGVFTNNKVIVDSNGIESVICDRSDGLAIDLLKEFIKLKNWDLKFFILSKEKNNVVKKRAEKLGMKCFNATSNKKEFILDYLNRNFKDNKNTKNGIVYLGNDLNDYEIMDYVGYSVAPIDAHKIILNKADLVIQKKGGEGFVRDFVEKLLLENGLIYHEIIKMIR